MPLGKRSHDDSFQSTKNEDWIAPCSVPQTTQKCSTTSDVCKSVASLSSVQRNMLLCSYTLSKLLKSIMRQYCFACNTTHEILLWIIQCSEATVEMKKCPITNLKNKCTQLQNCISRNLLLCVGWSNHACLASILWKNVFSYILLITHHV
jgi:hypothetical protein